MHPPQLKNDKLLYREKFIASNYSEFYNEIMKLFPDSEKYNEKLYRFLNHIDERPVCPECGSLTQYCNSPAHYKTYCSSQCAYKSKHRIDKIKQTKSYKYGDPNYNNFEKVKETTLKKYGGMGFASQDIRDKAQSSCLKKYGVKNVFYSKFYQKKIQNIKEQKYGEPYYSNKEKYKDTCLKKYGVSNPMQKKEIVDKFNKTMISKYGVKWAMYNEELKAKCIESIKNAHKTGKYNRTHKNNKSFNSSKIEKQFRDFLEKSKIPYIYQYRSDEYPFDCDFYIPDYKLFIEIQGCWTHGKKPYEGTEDDNKILECWKNKHTKFYDRAIYVWTELDVRKRKIAFDNKLNYLEIFSIKIEDCIDNFLNKIKELS